MTEPGDQLVQRATQGDHDALSELLDRHGPAVARVIHADIGDVWRASLDADDVMQGSYLEAFLHIRRMTARDERGFAAWLTRMARNNLRDAIRGLQSEKRPNPAQRVTGVVTDQSYVELLEQLSDSSGATPGRATARNEVRDMVEQAVQQLPRDYEQVLRLYDLEGHDAVEVGRRMGRSRGAVHMLRARAVAHLTEILGSGSKYFSDAP